MTWRSLCSCFCRTMWLWARAGVLHVLLPGHDLADRARLRPGRVPDVHDEHQRVAARVIVEYRLDRRVGEDAAIPIELAVDADRGEGGRQGARRHDVVG